MNLFLIILFLILYSLITSAFNKKTLKIFIIISILFVIFLYFFCEKKFFHTESFLPAKNINCYYLCCNYYNLLSDSLKKYKLYISDNINYDEKVFINKGKQPLLDTSIYKGKVYLYFGITPVLLFYLPFNSFTNLYLTDKFLVFILSCFIFLLSLFLIKKVLENITELTEIPQNVIILSIFLVGFCNLLPFLLIRSAIYEVAITTAVFLLLFSFCLFFYYLKIKNTKKQNILNFCLASTLCLAVGARPHYVLFIPIFFFFIILLKYRETKNIKDTIYTTVIFLIPCLFYGSIIALYNYFRFDSIFEFGWRLQINPINQIEFKPTFQEFWLGLKNNFFVLPSINEPTFFSLTKTFGHRIGKDYITGVFWTCPIIMLLLFIPKFLKQIYNKNINIFIFILLITVTIFINIIVVSFAGMMIRYIFEYLFLMIILSLIIFLFYIGEQPDKHIKNFFNCLFIFIFFISLFLNISLLFCTENFLTHDYLKNTYYSKAVKFLF